MVLIRAAAAAAPIITGSIMALGSSRVRRGRLPAAIALMMFGTSQFAVADAQVNFPRSGAFEGCLDAAFGKWVQAQAELQVNEDPAAQALDDAGVAAWTRATLDDCRKRAGSGDAASDDIFARYMSRWRDHVFDLASSIRQRGQSD